MIKPRSIGNPQTTRPTVPMYPNPLRDFNGWGPKIQY
jgi:hypothetical protein